jgi:hypothetical protein
MQAPSGLIEWAVLALAIHTSRLPYRGITPLTYRVKKHTSTDVSATKVETGVPWAEIEVTPAMIEAGEDVLLGALGGAVSTVFWFPRELAIEVYRAMDIARRKERNRPLRRNREGS